MSGSEWELGEAVRAEDRARLLQAGVDPGVLDGLQLGLVTGPGLPDWFAANGNRLYLAPRMGLPRRLIDTMTGAWEFSDALLVVATGLDQLASFLVGGNGATVFIGPRTSLTAGELFCGGGSSIVLQQDVIATRCAVLDARNGGTIVAAADQLWAANVYVATDDMHRLEDLETGVRLNPYGAHIRLGPHVWLGRDVTVTGHADIGEGAVVGARSLVRGMKVAAHTAVAGTPARVIREGVTWRADDRP